MTTFKNGDLVGVACSIQPGPFSHEFLVMVETEKGPFWGFVQKTDLEAAGDGETGYVKGAVLEAASDSIIVRMFGSFFRTAMGIATVKRDYLTPLTTQ